MVRQRNRTSVHRMKIGRALRALLVAALGALLMVVGVLWTWVTRAAAHSRLFDGSEYCPVVPKGVELVGGGMYDGFPPSITCSLSGYEIESGNDWSAVKVTQTIGADWPFWIGFALICVGLIASAAAAIRHS